MVESIKINENTYRIEDGQVRFYLFIGNKKAALIDTGMNVPDARSIAEELTDLPLILINFISYLLHKPELSFYINFRNNRLLKQLIGSYDSLYISRV